MASYKMFGRTFKEVDVLRAEQCKDCEFADQQRLWWALFVGLWAGKSWCKLSGGPDPITLFDLMECCDQRKIHREDTRLIPC